MDSWTHLSIYESTDLVKQVFRKRHSRELNTSKAVEITSAIAQGREYFDAASKAGSLVTPVLQYYGVLALSRGLILILSPVLRESALPQAHGLSSVGWGENLSRNEPDKLTVEVTNGTFLSLLQHTQNRDISRIFTGPFPSTLQISQAQSLETMPGANFTFDDVLSRAPELRIIYEKVFSKSALNYRAFVFSLPDYHTDVDIFPGAYGLPDEQALRAYFNIPADTAIVHRTEHNFTYTNGHSNYRLHHRENNDWLSLLPKLDNRNDPDASFGEISIVAPFANGIRLAKLSRYFLLSFFLGTLSRYHPTHWLGFMQRRQQGDFIMPLIRDAMNRIQQDYCSLVLEELER